MTLRACATAFRSPGTTRFLTALGLSALVHVSMPLVISGGGAREANAPSVVRTLTVRVVPQMEHPLVQPVAAAVPVVEERRERPRHRAQPVERVPAARAAPPVSQPQPERPAGALPDAPDLTYYAAKQLDVYPSLSTAIDLRYRGQAAADGVSGRALLLVLIDETGAVKDVSVVEAEPANYFEDDARRAFMAARFTPAYRNGRAVRSRVLIEVNYGVERASQ